MTSLAVPSTQGDFLAFDHLGGTSTTGDPDSWFPELWSWLISQFQVKSMFDVGCGVGFTQGFFEHRGVRTTGLDCEQVLRHHITKTSLVAHDLTQSPWIGGKKFDLVWSCDVAEHIEEQFVDNIIQTIVQNAITVVGFSAAPVGAGGHHHVNCQYPGYWIERFTSAGLKYDLQRTVVARSLCRESGDRGPLNYFKRSGLIFTV